MKKKTFLLKIVLITVAALILAFPLRSLCEDEDSISDSFCKGIDVFHYSRLLDSVTALAGVFYHFNRTVIHVEPIIFYLAMQEKSPPPAASFFIFK